MRTLQVHVPARVAPLAVCVVLCAAGLAPRVAAQEVEPLPAAPVSGDLRGEDMDRVLENLDPTADGWDTELMSARAQAALERLAAGLARPAPAEAGEPLLHAPDFPCSALRPAELEAAFEEGAIRVLHPPATGAEREPRTGIEGLNAGLGELGAPFEGAPHVATKFKVFAVEPAEDGRRFTTTVAYLAYGDAPDGYVQQNATWECDWELTEDGEDARLTGLAVLDYEEVVGPPGGEPLYEDCTASALGAEACYEEQLLPHLENWLGTMQASTWNGFLGHNGLAVADVDGDGLEDVYVCQSGGLPNLLFVQQSDGSARERAGASGIDFLDFSDSALFADFDQDGDADLMVTVYPNLLVLSNDGTGSFTLESEQFLPFVYSLAAADFDLDGDLDVYCCSYNVPDGANSTSPLPYHDANNGVPNTMLRNEGEWRFEDVTAEVGLDQNNQRFSFAGAWEDYDDDGDPDLYVANDFGRNNLYRNDGGRFTDVADEAGVEDISAGMGVTWGDFDGDGLMDLYVSNMWSSAGGRIAYQRRFQEGVGEDVRQQLQRHARGNSLFRNRGDGTFEDVSVTAGVTLGRWAWGAVFVDVDNDGWEDLVVPNGFATSEQSKDL